MAVNWTEDQKKILEHRQGNLLVSAAAGSGKTAVLIERLLRIIEDEKDPVDVDELLVLTFTKLAAAQMSEKLYKKLSEHAGEGNLRAAEQLGLLASAQISTIHSFCQRVIKDYITRIEDLDPGFRIADEIEIQLLRGDVLSEVLEDCYEQAEAEPDLEENRDFIRFVEAFGSKGGDSAIVEIINKLDLFMESQVDGFDWLDRTIETYHVTEDQCFEDTFWGSISQSQIMEERKQLYQQLDSWLPVYGEDGGKLYPALDEIRKQLVREERLQPWPKLRMYNDCYKEDPEKKAWAEEKYKKFKDQYQDLYPKDARIADPQKSEMQLLQQLYPILRGLRKVVRQFRDRFQEAKLEKNLLDFSDLEHYTLRILLNEDGTPTAAARELSEQYAYICIDEYQDSNQVQETLINAISRKNEQGDPINVFMVGDVKQSIYRFRQACPELFIEKKLHYPEQKDAAVVDLHQNFRSREAILQGINDIFYSIMTRETAEIDYTETESLVPGKSYPQTVELLAASKPELVVLGSEAKNSKERLKEQAEYTAERIAQLILGAYQVYDESIGGYRPIRYRDIVILMRSPGAEAQAFQDALKALNIPSHSEKTEKFYQAKEIQCIVNILKILDNPLQDIPLAGVLYSTIFEFSGSDLMEIRKNGGKELKLFHALMEYRDHGERPGLQRKVATFLSQIETWREKAGYLSVRDLIWELYRETGFYLYASAMTDGRVRKANLDLLLEKAQQFEKGSYSGLFHFLRYIAKMERMDIDEDQAVIVGEEDDVVRILSIHKSKGLEFPVVFLVRLEKSFNNEDEKGNLLFHNNLGIGINLVDDGRKLKYKTLARECVIYQKQKEMKAEEMRLLYVALTRAGEALILVGSESGKKTKDDYLSWVRPIAESTDSWNYRIQEPEESAETQEDTEQEKEETIADPRSSELYQRLEERMNLTYDHPDLSRLPARVSVSELKKTPVEQEQVEAQGELLFTVARPDDGAPSGAEIGTAIHKVLSLLDIQQDLTEEELNRQLEQLRTTGKLTDQEYAMIPMGDLIRFGNSELIRRMRNSKRLLREQPFILSLTVSEIRALVPQWGEELSGLEQERVMVQGIIDCCFLEDGRWILVDYKSDRYMDQARRAMYFTQLEIYQEALERGTGIPVAEKALYMIRTGRMIYGEE